MKSQLISNDELAKIPGYLEEREAKLLFYQFLRNNTTFTTDSTAVVVDSAVVNADTTAVDTTAAPAVEVK